MRCSKDGYKESDVIPIATNQAEKWYQHASKEELETLKQTYHATSRR